MAFRFSDERLEGRLALLAPLQGAEALTWDGSEWADISVRWESLWGHSSGAAPLPGRLLAGDAGPAGCGCLSCALSGKIAEEAKGADPIIASPASPTEEGPQFVGDAIGDNTSSTTTIAVGGTLSSLIDHAGDLDYIKRIEARHVGI